MITDAPDVRKEKIRKSLEYENKKVLEINIEYPVISRDGNDDDFKSINNFYKQLSENYNNYCESILYNKIKRCFNQNTMTQGEILKFFIPFNNGKHISFVCEVTHFDGYFKKIVRTSQTWLLKDNIILPASFFYKTLDMTPKKIKNFVGENIFKKLNNGQADFSYTDRRLRKYAYNINTNNYYLCKNGVAFWFDIGTIAPESEGFPTFVIPYKENKEPSC